MVMREHESLVVAIADAIREAFRRNQFAVDSPELLIELRGILSPADAQAAYDYLSGSIDAPISTIIKLARLVRLPLEKLVESDPRDFVQVLGINGGSPAHVFLPIGYQWSKPFLRQPLCYVQAPALEEECCEGVTPGDLLLLSRDSSSPVAGQMFLIQDDEPLELVRIYLGTVGDRMQFARSAAEGDPTLMSIPQDKAGIIAGRVMATIRTYATALLP